MKDIILSKAQVRAMKTIRKFGQYNYKALGIQKNTIESLKKIGVITEPFNGYVSRSI